MIISSKLISNTHLFTILSLDNNRKNIFGIEGHFIIIISSEIQLMSDPNENPNQPAEEEQREE